MAQITKRVFTFELRTDAEQQVLYKGCSERKRETIQYAVLSAYVAAGVEYEFVRITEREGTISGVTEINRNIYKVK